MDNSKYLPPKYSHALKDLAEYLGIIKDNSPERDKPYQEEGDASYRYAQYKAFQGLNTIEHSGATITPRLEPIIEVKNKSSSKKTI